MTEPRRIPVRHLRKGDEVVMFGMRGRVARLYRKRCGETIVTMRVGREITRVRRRRDSPVQVLRRASDD